MSQNYVWPNPSSSNASVGVNGGAIPTSSTLVAGENPSLNQQPLQTDSAGNLKTVLVGGTSIVGTVDIDQTTPGTTNGVVVNSSALPTGAATASLQTTGNSVLGSILLDLTNGTQITQISGTVPLPTGAATAALQTTGNASLASIDAGIPAGLGQTTASASMPVVLASDQSTLPIKPVDVFPATSNITIQDTGSTSNTYFNSQIWYSGTPTAGSFAAFSFVGIETGMLQISGTWTGTLQSEVSVDGGTTWIAHAIHQIGSASFSAAFTNNVVGSLNLSAKTNYRVRATTAITGTAVIRVIESFNPSNTYVANAIKLSDATLPNVATVKSASTAAVAADTAVVVAVSPNNSIASTTKGTAIANAPIQNVYTTTNITTATYTQLIASTTSAVNSTHIFDSSGQAMILAVGASGSEVVQAYIAPGGDTLSLAIPAGSRISYKALTANATAGYLIMSFFQ